MRVITEVYRLVGQTRSILYLVSAMRKGVDCLPMVTSGLYAINKLGIRRDCAVFLKYCRLLVVLSEGRDFCSLQEQEERV